MSNTATGVQTTYREWEVALEEMYFMELKLLEEEYKIANQEVIEEEFW